MPSDVLKHLPANNMYIFQSSDTGIAKTELPAHMYIHLSERSMLLFQEQLG